MKSKLSSGIFLAALGLSLWMWWSHLSSDGHERMLKLLQEIRDRTPDDNYYLGDAAVRQAKTQLAKLPVNATDSQRLPFHYNLGHGELRLGETEKAIEHLQWVYEHLSIFRAQAAGAPKHLLSRFSGFEEEVIFYLAVAYLRRGETQNCVHCQSAESCVLPIRGKGIHQYQSGSRQAIKYFLELLERNPQHLAARWLLNIASMTLGCYPVDVPEKFLIPPEKFESSQPFPRFVNVAADLGLNTVGLAGGAIVDDFDCDGFLDLVVSDSDPKVELRYFRNHGDGTFSERTKEAGFSNLFGGLNLTHADYDNDGDLDILVLRGGWIANVGHPNSLLQNDGNARFRDVTFEAGLGENHFPTQTAGWSDYDNDGDLDLYVGNENDRSQLFENNGNGTFTDVAHRAGVENRRFVKGVVWGDYNSDRYPDLYVSNLGQENRLYKNNADGTFTDLAPRLGVTEPNESFPVWFWDFNNDGALDIYVSTYSISAFPIGVKIFVQDLLGLPQNAEIEHLYQGDGKGAFRQVAVEQNVGRVTFPMGANFGDLNGDGFPDYYLGTGTPEFNALMPNLMFLNNEGNGFSDVTMSGGFGHLQKGHGVSFADIDNDGDQDVFIVMGGAYQGDVATNVVFENPGFGNHWITIKVVGHKSNRYGIGARIRVVINEAGTERSIYKWVNSGGSFGANPLRQEIGLGKASRIETLEVFWPTTNQTQQFHNVAANQFIEISEGQPQYRQLAWKTAPFRHRSLSPD